MNWKPDICIYHGPGCHDGFAAAWAVWKRWGDSVQFFPRQYGEHPPKLPDNANVLIVDFSFSAEILRHMDASSIIVLDHHATAQKDLAEIPSIIGPPRYDEIHCYSSNILAHFDMEKSGARLAWEFCYPHNVPHYGVRLIEDRDLWRWALPETRRFHLYLRTLPRTFEAWTDALTAQGRELLKMLDHAETVEKYHDVLVAEICKEARLGYVCGYYDVPIVDAPYSLISDVGHRLLDIYPDAPFAAVRIASEDGIKYSLRSDDTRVDVEEVARKFGGGGHHNAAGFTIMSNPLR